MAEKVFLSRIRNKPVRLVGQVITVSIETMKVVKALADLGLPSEKAEPASD